MTKVPPVATYRLQFRDGMTFDKAVGIVPYLKRLGVSHLYASPIFRAVTGSSHGYDITDHDEIDPAIGGRDGFERLHHALRAAGMGVVLDIVPNHMAASLENRWWRSVIELGAASPYAHHFDIDWQTRLTLPILGREPADALAAGELRIEADAERSCLALGYFDNKLPLHPSTYSLVAERLAGEDASMVERLAQARMRAEEAASSEWRSDLARLANPLAMLSRDPALLNALHDAQPWRLTFWKDARRDLSYRRFFEVTGLVGVRVEDDAVFDDVHRLILSLVRAGMVDGLRVDHVDGLAFPGNYLARLREEAGPDTWILVEKILADGERLPGDWHNVGTTGYEFIPAVADLLVEPQGARRLEEAYARFIGRSADAAAELREAKLLILKRNFEGELDNLVRLAAAAAQHNGQASHSVGSIEDAIVELIVAFPVYRTYGATGDLTPQDQTVVDGAAEAALKTGHADAAAIGFVASLLRGPAGNALDFRSRFQQLTGPVMAKSVEDTLFYRHNAFIALNEVGCSPGVSKGSIDHFHQAMQGRVEDALGLLATATHDTKRGEDARARLYALAEAPEVWSAAVARWSIINAGARTEIASQPAPGPNVEWLLYQSLAGLWPPRLDTGDAAALNALAERFLPYVEKALREAKERTDWLATDEPYEAAVRAYASRLFDIDNRAFLEDFAATLRPFAEAGAINSASQTMAKLTAPGIPDIYQGSERLDLSLVDPDNRRPADFDGLAHELERAIERVDLDDALLHGTFKQWMIARCLARREEHAALFAAGTYEPLPVGGAQASRFVAYLREHEDAAALVVLQRLPLQGQNDGAALDASIALPPQLQGMHFDNVLTEMRVVASDPLNLDRLLQGLPVALAIAKRGT